MPAISTRLGTHRLQAALPTPKRRSPVVARASKGAGGEGPDPTRREALAASLAASLVVVSPSLADEETPQAPRALSIVRRPPIAKRVFLDLELGGQPAGRVVVGLYSEALPKTCENFRALATGERGYGFRDSSFHRVVKNFVLQGGDFTNGNGTGGRSIYGGSFEDEGFPVGHFTGAVSMANRGPNTNGSQFFFVTNSQSGTPKLGEEATQWLDGKHCCFGEVDAEGLELCLRLQNEEVDFFSRPRRGIRIADCGELDA